MEKRLVTVEFTQDRFAIVRMRNGQNRLNLIFLDSLNQALNEVERNTDCKALITTGEGKFYSNGIDLDWIMSQDSETVVRFDKALENTMWRIMHFPLPTVAAINGHAFAGGAFLAMSHDYRVMRSDRGWISWNETHLKLRLGDMLLNLLSKKVLAMKAIREAVLFGKRVTANEAKELFLVDAMTELSELIQKAKQMAIEALGPNGIDREMLQRMKQDLYVRPSGEKSFLPETNLKASKL
ncbi:enoyl-CoA delta isomerase 1, peroxisomal-like [Mizuhopecten yessoensis]|uniref:enoyl-CoA delta isomerase 1, peroxisomal-like n=1 Tax=Mizuhopecten yessoensis TaxID=6573 RepID=UPI000B45C972|nr:enoyl-CoA delta isomerase 1, peroxisomal-like [Mizuhopecten yessoensis]